MAMRNRLYILVMMLAVSMSATYAQVIISGNIADAIEPLMMVNVVEVDESGRFVEATTTDMNGNFSMQVKNTKDKLQISYIGYRTELLPIGDRRVFNVVLKDENQIEEVVIKATVKRSAGGLEIPEREMSISAQSIKMSEFEGLNFTSVDEALQGRIAGLDIVMNSGNLGSGTTMRLRGVSSINGNAEPLIVVDGNVFESTGNDEFDYTSANEEKFAELLCVNPEDIESIDVLKDAAATAVWGSQGANGVIMIKTKRGSRGPTRVGYSYGLNVTYQPDGIRMLNGDDYTMFMKEAYFNPHLNDEAADLDEFNYLPGYSEYHMYNNNTDWVDAVKQIGMKHSHSVNLTGGGEKATFRVSGAYDTETGSIIAQRFDRFSTRVNLDYYVSDRIKIKSDFSLTYTNNNRNYSDLLGAAYLKMPNMAIYREDDNEVPSDEYYFYLQTTKDPDVLKDQRERINPVAEAYLAKNKQRNYRLDALFEIRYNLLSPDDSGHQLNYTGQVKMGVFNDFIDKYYPRELSTLGWADKSVNRSEQSSSKSVSFSTKHDLVFTPKFDNEDHFFTTLVRMEVNSGDGSGYGTIAYGLPSGDISSATTSGQMENMWTNQSQWRSAYFTYSGHYSYKSKYMFDVSARADGSTKFGPGKRWGVFPAVSGRWNIIDEPWMEWSRDNLKMSMLSLRPGWGRSGVTPGAEYLHFSKYSSADVYGDLASTAPNNIRLSDLQWETKTTWNLGSDIGFLEDMFTMDINIYSALTEDLLMNNVRIPSSTGFAHLSSKNVGSMLNQGWELNIYGNKCVKVGDFSAGFNFTLGNNVNQIVEMDEEVLASLNSDFNYANGSYLTRIQVANAFGSIYGFRSKGVYQYSEYSPEEIEGVSGPNAPVARDANGNVITDEKGEPLPMMFDYGGANYEFKGGDAIYEDVNHDGNINELDIVYLGNCNPLVTGGFGLRFFYKRWSMNMQFNYRYGSKVLNIAKMNAENMYDNNNQSYAVNWRWRTEGDVTTIPRALHQYGFNFLGSDRFVEDGSFCRLNYLQLSYNLPSEIAKRWGMKNAMLSVSANNLFNWTRYSGVDPEVGYGGYGLSTDNSKTPRAKSFTCRLNVTF